jgi:hypothetical protein
MKKIVIVLIFFASNLVNADSFSRFYRNCILQKRGHFNYNINQMDDTIRGLYTPSGRFDETTFSVVSGTIRGGTRFYDGVRNVVSVLRGSEFIEGKKIRDWTIDTLRSEAKKYSMNSFEKASLVTCAVFSLVNYKPNISTKLGSIYDIYEEGEGICTEMTAIALDLGRALGLKVRSMVSNQDHNWPEYKITGTWYVMDPTSNSYEFLEAIRQ